MSSVKLNPGVDLGLNPDVVAEEQLRYPRELAMEVTANEPTKVTNGFNGIMDISSASNVLKNTPKNSTQQVAEINSLIPSEEHALEVPGAMEPRKPADRNNLQPQKNDQTSQAFMIISLILFLISLSAAVYFAFKYFFS